MYKSFRVQNFRGFKDLQLNDLARVNLIAGRNNVGKTALLEALFMYSGGYVAELAIRLQRFRDMPVDSTFWSTLFYQLDPNNIIKLCENITEDGTIHFGRTLELEILRTRKQLEEVSELIQQSGETNGSTITTDSYKVLELRYTDEDGTNGRYHLFQTNRGIQGQISLSAIKAALVIPNKQYPDEDAKLIGELLKSKKEKFLVDALKILEPRLVDITSVPYGDNTNLILVDIGLPQRVPLGLMGQGFSRLLSILLRIADQETSAILIDEIENGLHYSVLEDVWRILGEISQEYNVQIFATTHSREMIEAAHKAFRETDEDDFRFYRLDRDIETSDIVAVSYTEKTMEAAIQLDYEVRG